jgi:hypothetical protein
MLKRQNHLLPKFVGRAYTATPRIPPRTRPQDMTMFSSHTRCRDMIICRHHGQPQVTSMLRRHHGQYQVMDTSSRHVPPPDTTMTTVHCRHVQPRCLTTVLHNAQPQDGGMSRRHALPLDSHTFTRHNLHHLHRLRLDLMLRRCGVVLARFHSYHRQSQKFQLRLRTRQPPRIRTRTNRPIRGSRWLIGA